MIDVVPVPHKDVAYTIIDGSAILVAPRDSELYWLNSVASRIWELADGKNTVGMIAERICREYEVDTETALRDAGGMVQSFAEKRLFTLGRDTDNA